MFETVAAVVGSSFERAPWGWGVFALLIAGYFKLKPLMVKLKNEREANLLNERAEEMEAMRDRLTKMEARQEQKDAQHEAERAADRHRINNLSQCLDALLMLIEADPKKAAEAAVKIKTMRATQIDAEAREKAAIQAAKIAAVADKGEAK